LKNAASRYQEKGKFKELFWKANIRQTLIVVGINFFLQTTGFIFHIIYGSVYIRSLGTINPFNVGLITSFVGLAMGVAVMWGCDIFGRR
jgi:MFS transporter, SP family, sugar:H+ symporter